MTVSSKPIRREVILDGVHYPVSINSNKSIGRSGRIIDGEIILQSGPNYLVRCFQHVVLVRIERITENEFELFIGNRSVLATIIMDQLASLENLAKHPSTGSNTIEIKAPMPGLIVRLDVSPNQLVECNDTLLVLEAMKMENEIRSPTRGTIVALKIQRGEKVEKGQHLLSIRDQA